VSPVRIQRRRTKGWRMPEGAVYVGRPTLWGNPWIVRELTWIEPLRRAEVAVGRYREEMGHLGLLSDSGFVASEARADAVAQHMAEVGAANMGEYAAVVLRGKDLVCWCPLDQPCHADVLLELANP